jgi:hypothetical protein
VNLKICLHGEHTIGLVVAEEPHELVLVISSVADLVFMIGWVPGDEHVYATKFSVQQGTTSGFNKLSNLRQ